MIENLNDLKLRQLQVNPVQVNSQSTVKKKDATFDQMLQEKMEQAQSLQFSKHSKERMEQRGIEMTPDLLQQMNTAANHARSKGAKDVVMIGPQAAFIVSIPNNTVITAMNGNEMKNNIFTKIDSAVLL